MRIALAQINPKVGDLARNEAMIQKYALEAKERGADLLIFPELSLTGYPPRDLLDFDYFVEDNLAMLERLKGFLPSLGMVVGYIDRNPAPTGRKYFNAAALLYGGEIQSRHFKGLLPTYDVFDETRYFEPAASFAPVLFQGKRLGITICEDIWSETLPYATDPVAKLVEQGIDLLINISASPYWTDKEEVREQILHRISTNYGISTVYVNQVGGNDDLVFDGESLVVDPAGKVRARAHDFREDLIFFDTETLTGDLHSVSDSPEESLLRSLELGLKDYCRKSGFSRVVLGLSGGIDSALVAAIACRALGSENVLGLTMPSHYSSGGSVQDSLVLAKNLGMECLTVPIAGLVDAFLTALQPGQPLHMDLAEENLQARIRGNLLMFYSNRDNRLLLSTGNKSELSVGYCTLYGDMAGGLAVISDVPKTMVYRLARHLNRDGEVIPQAIIDKAPSAELRPDQKDQDSLPPYEVLDDILESFVERNESPEQIAERYPMTVVRDVLRKVNAMEYKRRQAALGLKVTTKAFGIGRRIPVVQGYTFHLGNNSSKSTAVKQ